MPPRLLAGIEAGGTKMICAVAAETRGTPNILAETRIETGHPATTLPAIRRWFADTPHRPVALGIAGFGPMLLRAGDPDRGRIERSPKLAWNGVNLARDIADFLGVPLAIDTDVNGAALAEATHGAGTGRDTVYVTIGTGIGGGTVIGGRLRHGDPGGENHPEMGHMRVRRAAIDDGFPGVCPWHGDCLEGMASGPAVAARLAAGPIGADDSRDRLAFYIGQLCAYVMLFLAPGRIVLGGGVMGTEGLLDAARARAVAELADYPRPFGLADAERLIVAPGLGTRSGLIGALMLAAGLLPGDRG